MRLAALLTMGRLAFLGVAALGAAGCDELDDVDFLLSVGDVDGHRGDGFEGGGILVVVIDDDSDRDDDSGPDIVNRPGLRVPRPAPLAERAAAAAAPVGGNANRPSDESAS